VRGPLFSEAVRTAGPLRSHPDSRQAGRRVGPRSLMGWPRRTAPPRTGAVFHRSVGAAKPGHRRAGRRGHRQKHQKPQWVIRPGLGVRPAGRRAGRAADTPLRPAPERPAAQRPSPGASAADAAAGPRGGQKKNRIVVGIRRRPDRECGEGASRPPQPKCRGAKGTVVSWRCPLAQPAGAGLPVMLDEGGMAIGRVAAKGDRRLTLRQGRQRDGG
jgi:hypothetical protein